MKNYNKAIVGIAGSAAVIAALYITKQAGCLWGLVLVTWMIEQVD